MPISGNRYVVVSISHFTGQAKCFGIEDLNTGELLRDSDIREMKGKWKGRYFRATRGEADLVCSKINSGEVKLVRPDVAKKTRAILNAQRRKSARVASVATKKVGQFYRCDSCQRMVRSGHECST